MGLLEWVLVGVVASDLEYSQTRGLVGRDSLEHVVRMLFLWGAQDYKGQKVDPFLV